MGNEIEAEQLYVETSMGIRILDIVATSANGALVVYEVKANYATRSSTQLMKGEEIYLFGGTVRSVNKEYPYGSIFRAPTGHLNVICRSTINVANSDVIFW